ncbi:unnamed protein product [Bathycoccus prasinos]
MLFSYKSISLLQSSLGRKKLREREVKMMTRFKTAKCITYKNCPSKCAQCEESKYAHHMPKRHSSLKNGVRNSSPTHLFALVGVSFARIIPELSANHIFMASFLSWLVAQVAKLFTNCYRKGRWELKVMFDSGGMPSSHTSLVFSLTTAIALQYGLGSPLFPLSLAFSLIVAYDAAGVRRHAGKQAEVLNRILADVFHGSPISDTKLKEVLGHSPLQVTCGAVVGILVGSFYMLRFA